MSRKNRILSSGNLVSFKVTIIFFFFSHCPLNKHYQRFYNFTWHKSKKKKSLALTARLIVWHLMWHFDRNNWFNKHITHYELINFVWDWFFYLFYIISTLKFKTHLNNQVKIHYIFYINIILNILLQKTLHYLKHCYSSFNCLISYTIWSFF